MEILGIAHRGRHLDCFENTAQAFKEAVAHNYYGVETDIHLTKDKKWIVHHDPDFLTNGVKKVIKDEKLEDLIKMPLDNEFGYKDAYCPTFEEYLDIIKGSGKRPIIEIKPKNPSFHELRKMTKIIKSRFDLKDITVIAFYPWPLIKLRLMFGLKIYLQMLIEGGHLFLTKWAKFFKMDIDIDYNCLTEELIKEFHDVNLKVNTWTVDDPQDLKKLEKMGVDFITSNKFDQDAIQTK